MAEIGGEDFEDDLPVLLVPNFIDEAPHSLFAGFSHALRISRGCYLEAEDV